MQPNGDESNFKAPWGNINLTSNGDRFGQPVFLAHGRQDCAATFEKLMHFLPGKNFHYVAIDLPGSNTSDPLPIGIEATTVYEAIPDKQNIAKLIDPQIPLPLSSGYDIVNIVTGIWAKVLCYDHTRNGYWILLTPKPDDLEGRLRFRLAPAKETPTSNQQNTQEPIRCNDHGDRRCPFATRMPAFEVPPEGAVTPLPEHLAKTPVVTKITPEDVTKAEKTNQCCMMTQTNPSEMAMALRNPHLNMPTTSVHPAPDKPLTVPVKNRRALAIPRATLRKMARTRYAIKTEDKDTQTDPPRHNVNECFFHTPGGSFPLCTHIPEGLIEWIHVFFQGMDQGHEYEDPHDYFPVFAENNMPRFMEPPNLVQPMQYQPPPPYSQAYPGLVHAWSLPSSVPRYAMQPPAPRAYYSEPEFRVTPPIPLISRPRLYVPDHPSAFAYNTRYLQNQPTPPPRRPHTTQPLSSLPNWYQDPAQFNPPRPSTTNNAFRPKVAAFVKRGNHFVPFTVNQVSYTKEGIPILPDWSKKLGKSPPSPIQGDHQMYDVEPFLYADGCRHKTVSGEGCPLDPEKRKKSKEQEKNDLNASLAQQNLNNSTTQNASNASLHQELMRPPPPQESSLEEKLAYYEAMVAKCVKIMRFHFLAAMEMAIEHLGWDKFIFIGHSMGCELGLFFNAIYPGRITKMIFLDAEPTLRRLQVVDLAEYQPKFYDGYYDNYEKENHFFRTYTIPEATKALMRSRNLSEDAATTIIKKSLIHVDGDQYRFTWDRRLKLPAPQNYPNSYYFALFKNVPPTLLISASQSLNAKTKYSPGSLELIRMMTGLENFKQVIVEGDHDVHLSHPERVAPYVVEFLTKNVVLPSKL